MHPDLPLRLCNFSSPTSVFLNAYPQANQNLISEPPMPGKLKLNATWNLDPLPASDQTSLAYLLVDITQEDSTVTTTSEQVTQHSALSTQNSLNLSLVLDTSGSMGGAKLQNLKSAVRWVLEYLSPQDSVAVTLFDDEVHPLIPTTRLSDAQGLAAQVDAIREAGGTAMSKG